MILNYIFAYVKFSFSQPEYFEKIIDIYILFRN